MSDKSLNALRESLLQDDSVRREYERLEPEFAVARTVIKARTARGFSQAQLAERMGTTQSVIARLESGRQLPSLRTWVKLAEAVGAQPRFDLDLT
jgi:ribosome-binding protein aMBF1 (putative translation factor)